MSGLREDGAVRVPELFRWRGVDWYITEIRETIKQSFRPGVMDHHVVIEARAVGQPMRMEPGEPPEFGELKPVGPPDIICSECDAQLVQHGSNFKCLGCGRTA